MKIGFSGFGIWARGLCGTQEFLAAQEQDFAGLAQAEFVTPKPAAVPPKERRRAGLMINLAVEVAHQACEHAGADKQQIPSVFASAMGDTTITNYMCRKLSQPEKLLSPTKFHNSVHNAPSGYWTISAENRAPSSFVGGFRQSFGAGLLEAASQAQAWSTPVLLVAYDIANSAPFADIQTVSESLGMALVVTDGSGSSAHTVCAELEFGSASGGAASVPEARVLQELAAANPVGDGLTLLEFLSAPTKRTSTALRIAAAPAAHLELRF